MTATVCETCHRPLRDTASRKRRYGPVCFRRKFGAPPKPRGIGAHHAVAAPAAVEHHPVDPNQIPLPLETKAMTEDEIKAYAEYLIHANATDVEHLSIFEMYEDYADDDSEISDEDGRKVTAMLSKAEVTITWPASGTVQEGQN